jgi:hypothetical protein
MHTHNACMQAHAQRTGIKIYEDKRGQSIQTFIFWSWSWYLCQTHLFSSRGRVQLHGGAANWWSSSSRVGLAEPEPCQTRPKLDYPPFFQDLMIYGSISTPYLLSKTFEGERIKISLFSSKSCSQGAPVWPVPTTGLTGANHRSDRWYPWSHIFFLMRPKWMQGVL